MNLSQQFRIDERYKTKVLWMLINQYRFKIRTPVQEIISNARDARNRRDRLMRRTDISVMVKADLLEELETEMKIRLAFVPELRKKANVPILQGGL